MRNFFKSAAIIMAGMLGFSQAQSSAAIKVNSEIKATTARKSNSERLPFVSPVRKSDLSGSYGVFGLTPKQYGQIYGNGGSKKSNRLRYSHNAKVKRRIA